MLLAQAIARPLKARVRLLIQTTKKSCRLPATVWSGIDANAEQVTMNGLGVRPLR